MKILRKEGDSIHLLCFPDEEVDKGDYLLVTDRLKDRSLIVQIIDIQYANIQESSRIYSATAYRKDHFQAMRWTPLKSHHRSRF